MTLKLDEPHARMVLENGEVRQIWFLSKKEVEEYNRDKSEHMRMNRSLALLPVWAKKILDERVRQDKKWGEQNHSDLYWLGILMEEVGEVAKAVIERGGVDQAHLSEELVQCASVCVAWWQAVRRRPLHEKASGP